MSNYQYPDMTPAGSNPAVPGYPHLRAAPQADIRHVDLRVLRGLELVAERLGKVITIHSGYRSPSYSSSVGGYSNDPHARGVGVDANIGGVLIGQYPGAMTELARAGLESGNRPGFYHGQPDPEHVQIPGSGVNKALHAIRTLAGLITGQPDTPLAPVSIPGTGGGSQPAGLSGTPAGAGCATIVAASLATWAIVIGIAVYQWT